MQIPFITEINEQLLISLFVFGAVACAVWSFFGIWNNIMAKSTKLSDNVPPFFRMFKSVIAVFTDLFSKPPSDLESEKYKKLVDTIRRSSYNLKPQEIYGAQVLGGILGFIFGSWMAYTLRGKTSDIILILFVLAFTVLLSLLPYTMVLNAAEKRQRTILAHLPFAIDLITSSMDAGLDFVSAVRYLIDIVGENTLNKEFAIFLKDVELGRTRSEALQAMEQRLAIKEVTRFVSAISYAIATGTPIIDIMKIQVEEMRRARFARAEELAEKAPQKMILPLFVFIFPCLLILLATSLYLQLQSAGVFQIMGNK